MFSPYPYTDEYGRVFVSDSSTLECLQSHIVDGAWSEPSEFTLTNFERDCVVWSSIDIKDTDDTVYVQGTDPIPVTGLVGYQHSLDGAPMFPAYDTEKYKYAFVVSSMTYGLYLSPVPWTVYTGDDGYEHMIPEGGSTEIMYYSSYYKAPEWTDREEIDTNGGCALALWANFDVLDENGNVVLAASEPTPVYEKE